MDRKKIKLTILTLIISIVGFLSYKIVTKTQEKTVISNSIKTIPEFSYKTLDNTIFNKGNLKHTSSIVFIYFNSDCDFCHHEAQSISESINKFNNIQLIFISTESIKKIKAFSSQYNLHNKESITFLNDEKENFSTLFNATSTPYTLIYDKEQSLVKTHKGQLNASGILRIVNQ